MAVLPIRTYGDPVLKTRAREIQIVTDAVRRLAADMLETMQVEGGVGLAANQVGSTERVFVAEQASQVGPPRRYVILNPVITGRGEETETAEEGCLSFPGLFGPVERHREVTVEGLDLDGRPIRLQTSGLLARAVQHELDHLDGILFVERMALVQRLMLSRQLRELAKQTKAALVRSAAHST